MKTASLLLLTSTAFAAPVAIRADGVFLFDGKPEFPIGFTTAPVPGAAAPSGGAAYAELAKDGVAFKINTQRPGEEATVRTWLARWRPEPIPRSEWIEFQRPGKVWNSSPAGPFIYGFQGSRLMAMRFDAKQLRMTEPFAVRLAPGSPVEIRPTDNWYVKGPGIIFARQESMGSVWIMKLPE